MEILFGTQNPGKQSEIKAILANVAVELRFPSDFPELIDEDPAETGETFRDNALLKAKAFAQKAQLPTIADDSGLEVNVLDGAPGVHSKRFIAGTDEDRNKEILIRLEGQTDRAARFVSVLCLYFPQTDTAHFFEGEVVGSIANNIEGAEGFGYDPIFIPEGYDQTFASLGVQEKNLLSHRKRALEKLKEFIKTL